MHCSRIMTPNPHFILNGLPLEPVSRTYQYRKIMKPMLERKRRARINKCLDELKDLMTGTLQADGENVSKLEKADILELTVRHLQRLRQSNALFVRSNETLIVEKFWAGFQHCAMEVSQFLGQYDQSLSGEFLKHMAGYKPNISAVAAAAVSPSTSEFAIFNVATPAGALNNQRNKSHPATPMIPGVDNVERGFPLCAKNSSEHRVRHHPYLGAAVKTDGWSISVCPAGGEDEMADGNVWRPW